MFNSIFAKLTGLLSSKEKAPTTSTTPSVAPSTAPLPAVTTEVAVAEDAVPSRNGGGNRCGSKARSRDERRASRGKGARRLQLYAALEG